MTRIAVIHLVRFGNPFEVFDRFLSSYQKHPAGIDHDLVIVFKGFSKSIQREPYHARLAGIKHQTLHVSDRGFDLSAYFKAAKKLDADVLMFLNSFSVILHHDWLVKLYDQLNHPEIGLVGATGSWAGLLDQVYRQKRRCFKYYPWYDRWSRVFYIRLFFRNFGMFPNPHIRTNAFMLRRTTMLRLKKPCFLRKVNAYRFESGNKIGMTYQIRAMGLGVRVVDCNGKGYPIERWPDSATFWQDQQQRVLIADNQTRDYTTGSYARKRFLARLAWKSLAHPIPMCEAPPVGLKYQKRKFWRILLRQPCPKAPAICRKSDHCR